jgi:hypothetical protein
VLAVALVDDPLDLSGQRAGDLGCAQVALAIPEAERNDDQAHRLARDPLRLSWPASLKNSS